MVEKTGKLAKDGHSHTNCKVPSAPSREQCSLLQCRLVAPDLALGHAKRRVGTDKNPCFVTVTIEDVACCHTSSISAAPRALHSLGDPSQNPAKRACEKRSSPPFVVLKLGSCCLCRRVAAAACGASRACTTSCAPLLRAVCSAHAGARPHCRELDGGRILSSLETWQSFSDTCRETAGCLSTNVLGRERGVANVDAALTVVAGAAVLAGRRPLAHRDRICAAVLLRPEV